MDTRIFAVCAVSTPSAWGIKYAYAEYPGGSSEVLTMNAIAVAVTVVLDNNAL